MNQPDIIEISSSDQNKEIDISAPSVNFGGGIELLMNEKKKDGTKSPTSDINISDLTNLENELNDLSSDITTPKEPSEEIKPLNISKSSVFSSILPNDSSKDTINIETIPARSVSFEKEAPKTDNVDLGKSAAGDINGSAKTWDGYSKFNNIPIDPDKSSLPKEVEMSKEELLKSKFEYLRKLESLEKKGATLTKQYTMESSLPEMQGEYETLMSEKEKKNSVQFQGKMLMAFITGIEFLNNKFDPFDFKLDGWAEQVNENINDYDEIFTELHDKYKSKAKMAPEVKLLFQLGGSALMLHMTNTMFKSAMPGMDDIMRQNPVLAQQFTQAAMNSMGDQNPGFSDFMNNVMNQDDNNGPPPPMKTKNMAPSRRSSNNVSMSVDPDTNSGVSAKSGFASVVNGPEKTSRRPRAEMSGPSVQGGSSPDITNILEGLKTKKVDVKKDDTSTISIQELKEMHADMGIGKSGKSGKSSRRNKSDSSNTISLDI